MTKYAICHEQKKKEEKQQHHNRAQTSPQSQVRSISLGYELFAVLLLYVAVRCICFSFIFFFFFILLCFVYVLECFVMNVCAPGHTISPLTLLHSSVFSIVLLLSTAMHTELTKFTFMLMSMLLLRLLYIGRLYCCRFFFSHTLFFFLIV